MSKKMKQNLIAIVAMVLISFGIVGATKYVRGDFDTKEKVELLQVEGFTSEDATIQEASRLLDKADETVGYSVVASATGYNSQVPVCIKVTFDATKTNITSFEVVKQDETQGLGANITTEEFANQINGLAAPVYTADMETTGSAFDQITGATFSSKAVATAINAAYEFVQTVE